MDKFNFGNKICELRTQQKLTQKQLASYLGVSDKAVSKWENGEALPRVATMKALAECLGTTYSDLLSDDNEAKTYPPYELYYRKALDKAKFSIENSFGLLKINTVVSSLTLIAFAVLYFFPTREKGNFLNTWVVGACLGMIFIIDIIISRSLLIKMKQVEKISLFDLLKPEILTAISTLLIFATVFLSSSYKKYLFSVSVYLAVSLLFQCFTYICIHTKCKIPQFICRNISYIFVFSVGLIGVLFFSNYCIDSLLLFQKIILSAPEYSKIFLNEFIITLVFWVFAVLSLLLFNTMSTSVASYVFIRDNPKNIWELDSKKIETKLNKILSVILIIVFALFVFLCFTVIFTIT